MPGREDVGVPDREVKGDDEESFAAAAAASLGTCPTTRPAAIEPPSATGTGAAPETGAVKRARARAARSVPTAERVAPSASQKSGQTAPSTAPMCWQTDLKIEMVSHSGVTTVGPTNYIELGGWNDW